MEAAYVQINVESCTELQRNQPSTKQFTFSWKKFLKNIFWGLCSFAFTLTTGFIIYKTSVNTNESSNHVCVPKSEIPDAFNIPRTLFDLSLHPNYEYFANQECGEINDSINGHLWSGVLLNNNKTLECGVTLIAGDAAILARHCVHENNITLKFGCLDTSCSHSSVELTSDEIKLIDMPHEDHTLLNDIVLVKFSRNITARNIQPICLPLDNQKIPKDLILASFHPAKDENCSKLNYFKRTNMTLVSNEVCREKLSNEFPASCDNYPHINEHHLCAGEILDNGELKGSIKGESGNALQGLVGSRYFQFGIVSWGGNGLEDKPSVFVNIPSYLEWILDNIR